MQNCTSVTCPQINLGIATVEKVGGGSLDPKRGEFDLTAGWGHAGAGGICMPGRGHLELRQANDPEQVKLLGEPTCDVFLNDKAYWANMPQSVWDYHIGGYQVIKKWLSYREKSFLGRALKIDEIEYVTEMARRIAVLIILQPALDANYEAVKDMAYTWPSNV